METVFDTDLHFDGGLTLTFKLWIGKLNSKINFLDNFGIVVSVD